MTLKGKKICCFVALPHHSRFLWPIMEEARKAGATVQFFTTLSDYPYERDIVKRGIECRLLQSYIRAEHREKIVKTSEKFFTEWTPRLFEWDGMRHWPLVTQSMLMMAAIEEYYCFDEFIRAERPNMILALHERNRWGKLMGHFTHKYGAAYLTLQEGEYYEDRLSFSGHSEYTTALMLWGEDTADRLERHGSARNKMVYIGNTHLAQVGADHFTAAARRKTREELGIPLNKKVVLFLVGLQWAVVKSPEVWGRLLEGLGDDVVKVFKWHPKVTIESFKKDYVEMFKERHPTCIVVQNFDAYQLLAVADYCVTLGKTTLAVEALSFGKPLFSLPGLDNEPDHYADQGISQSVLMPIGWEPLYKTINEGVPTAIQEKVDSFMEKFFHHRNRETLQRARKVMEILLTDYSIRKGPTFSHEAVSSRVSFIVPSGDNVEALISTIVSLAEKVQLPDWEVVIVLNAPSLRESLAPFEGDLTVIEAEGVSLGALYNKGAESAHGEVLVFMRPGVLYFKEDNLIEAARGAVAGVPLRDREMRPYCFGIGFNFNSDPFFNIDSEKLPQAVGGGILAIDRSVFERVRGFDPEIANHFVEADLCLAVESAGVPVRFQGEGLALSMHETFYNLDRGDDTWPRRIRFFAKWQGKLPKDEDYVSFAGDLMRA